MKTKAMTRKEDQDFKDFLEFRAEMRKIAKTFTEEQWRCIGYLAGMIMAGTLIPFIFERTTGVKIRE